MIKDIITRMLSPESPLLEPQPEPTHLDYFAAVVKLAVSSIPDWGGPASELFGMLTAPLLGKRRDEWFEELRLRLNDLTSKVEGLTIESLARNEDFVSVVVDASQTAIKTHQRKKIEALRNAVLNVAVGTAPATDKQSIFLQYVERLQPLHLELLAYMEDPKEHGATWVNHQMGSTSVYEVIYKVFPALCNQFQLVNLVVIDLQSAGFIAADIRSAMAQAPRFPKWVTFHGEEFLKFIREPEISSSPENKA
jgi:hypothetical protein